MHIICVCIYTSIQLECGTGHQLKQLVILLHQMDRLGLSHSWFVTWHKLCVSAPVHSTRYHLKATVMAWHIYITPCSVENCMMLGSYLVWILDTFQISHCFIWWQPVWKQYSWSNVFNKISVFHDFFYHKNISNQDDPSAIGCFTCSPVIHNNTIDIHEHTNINIKHNSMIHTAYKDTVTTMW